MSEKQFQELPGLAELLMPTKIITKTMRQVKKNLYFRTDFMRLPAVFGT